MLRTLAILQVTGFAGLTRRSPHRFTLCVSGCGSLPAHIWISRVRASSLYLLPSKSHTVSYTRFACDDPACVFEELIQYIEDRKMIDKKRLYLMIGLARFEKKHADGSFRISRYYQRDYTAFALIRNLLLSTIAYILLLGVLMLANMDTFLSRLNAADIRPVIAVLIVSYVIFVGIYSVIAYILARIRYVRMQSDMEEYERALARLGRMYRRGYHEDSGEREKQEEEEE